MCSCAAGCCCVLLYAAAIAVLYSGDIFCICPNSSLCCLYAVTAHVRTPRASLSNSRGRFVCLPTAATAPFAPHFELWIFHITTKNKCLYSSSNNSSSST